MTLRKKLEESPLGSVKERRQNDKTIIKKALGTRRQHDCGSLHLKCSERPVSH